MKKITTLILGASTAISFCSSILAQADSNQLEEIVVVANRIPLPLRQIVTSISVINAEEIAAHGNTSLVNVLRQLPSISISSNGGASEKADFFLSLSDFETGGFNTRDSDNVLADDDGYENTTIHARLGFDITDDRRLDVTHRNVEGETRLDGCFSCGTVHDCASNYDLEASRLGLEYTTGGFTHSLLTQSQRLTVRISRLGILASQQLAS